MVIVSHCLKRNDEWPESMLSSVCIVGQIMHWRAPQALIHNCSFFSGLTFILAIVVGILLVDQNEVNQIIKLMGNLEKRAILLFKSCLAVGQNPLPSGYYLVGESWNLYKRSPQHSHAEFCCLTTHQVAMFQRFLGSIPIIPPFLIIPFSFSALQFPHCNK